MKTFPRKAIAMLLLLVIAASAGACGGESTGADTTAADTTATAETTSRWLDDLPDDLDFGGEEVVIHTRGDVLSMQEVGFDEENGDILNDAIYRRNRDIEGRLNVKITPYIGAAWNNYIEEVSKIRASVFANDNQWQMIAGWYSRITPLFLEGAFMPLDDMEYLDFDAPWWSITKNSKVNLSGERYFMLGDASLLTILGGTLCLYQNDRIAEDFKIPDVTQIVLDGKWTIDKLAEITKTVYRDIDGDSTHNDKDLYGLLTNIDNSGQGYFIACDIHQIETVDGKLTFVPALERVSKVLEKLWPFYHEGESVNSFANNDNAVNRTMFLNGQGLFLTFEVQSSYVSLREFPDDFTILPFPKLDETQERYYSPSHTSATIWSIPIDNPNPDAAAAVLEALSAENYRSLAEVYYETCLQTKYSRNDNTVEMLRVIRDNMYIDDEHMYKRVIGDSMNILVELLKSGNNTPASWYESKTSSIEAAIESLEEALAE